MNRTPFLRSALWPLLPAIMLTIIGYGLSLLGQSPEYWQGNYLLANEATPTFAWLLSLHPIYFVLGVFFWIIIFWAVYVLLPETLALIFALTITIGNTAGAWSWLIYGFKISLLANILFIFTAAVIIFAFKRNYNPDARAVFDWQQTGLPDFVRWFLIVFLLAFPTWWFIIPR